MSGLQLPWGLATTLAVCAILTTTLWAQPNQLREFGNFQTTPPYSEAMRQILGETGSRSDGIEQLLQIARGNPNTALGAHAYFSAATYAETRGQMIEILEEVVRNYPNSRFEISGACLLAKLKTKNFNDCIRELERIVTRYGAPNVGEILNNPAQALGKFRSLPPAVQDALNTPYADFAQALCSPNIGRLDDGLKMCSFGSEAYSQSESARTNFDNEAGFAHRAYLDQLKVTQVASRPRVKVRTSYTTCGPRPAIRFEVSLRDNRSMRMHTNAWHFYLDGQEVTKGCQAINFRTNLRAKKNQIFQQYAYEFRPPRDLEAGRHSFTGIITNYGELPAPDAVTFGLDFRVKKGERNDWDDDIQQWHDRDDD